MMQISISYAVAIITSTISFVSFCFYIITLNRLKKTTSIVFDLFLKNSTLINAEIDEPTKEIVNDIHKDSFIKFLSDSRDWAFEYIDKSQKQIKEFIEIADREFAFFDSYGVLSQEYPHYETMKTISEEYKKLKSLLPEETDDRR